MKRSITQDLDYDLFCNQQLQDPYPLFARLRAEEPVHWCEPMNMWLISRYDDVLAGLKDTKRLLSSRTGMYFDPLTPTNRELAKPMVDHIGFWMQNLNPPDHTRIRKLVNLVFTTRMLQKLVPRIDCIVEELLDKVCANDETDFYQSFCLPLPAMVVCEMLGIPDEDQDRYHETLERFFRFSGGAGPRLNDAVVTSLEAMNELLAYFDVLVEKRRREPRDDLISAMAAAEADGDRLSRDELFALCVFLYLAGHETTVSLLSSGTKLLLQHPHQFDLLKADPDKLLEPAVEEFLRYDAPVTRAVRVPAEPISFNGHIVPEGQTVMLLLGSANRDPSVFEEPDRLDIKRWPNRHLGFGHGIHFCLGASLARLEANIAFKAIARRLPDMNLATDRVRWGKTGGIRSIEPLPVVVRGSKIECRVDA